MSYFVFAEFGDDEVPAFLRKLRNALSCDGDTIESPIHVTLRGPYPTPPSLDELAELASLLPGYGVKISGHGYFPTAKGYAVFVRAECSVFRLMWDKPDYKVSLARIQPHITLFESRSHKAAKEVRDFLKKEGFLIQAYNLHLSLYESKAKQRDLFGLPIIESPRSQRISQDVWQVPEGILDRAKSLGEKLTTQELPPRT